MQETEARPSTSDDWYLYNRQMHVREQFSGTDA